MLPHSSPPRAPGMRSVLSFVGAWLAVLTLAACSRSAPAAPESAFRAFRDALRYGDGATVWAMLTPASQSRLSAIAADADEPWRSLRVAWAPTEADIDTLERVSIDEQGAVLRVTTYHGDSHDVALVRHEGSWLVELDLTRVADAAEPAQDGAALEGSAGAAPEPRPPAGGPGDSAAADTAPVDGR